MFDASRYSLRSAAGCEHTQNEDSVPSRWDYVSLVAGFSGYLSLPLPDQSRKARRGLCSSRKESFCKD